MPHTSHKKKNQRTKRAEIHDEDGWTRVTTTNGSHRAPRPLPAQQALEERYQGGTVTYPHVTLPADKTVEQVEEQYRKYEKRWLESESYQELQMLLKHEVDKILLSNIDQCIVFGTGTFSGLGQGWIDRTHVSMFQLAAFMSVVDTIEKNTGKRPLTYAQEPIYTSLDLELLARLKIETVESPIGFQKITPYSMTFALGAELEVTLRTLAGNPAMAVTTGKLDMFWRNEKGEACTNAIQLWIQDDSRNHVSTPDQGNEAAETQLDNEELKPLHEMTDAQRRQCEGGRHITDSIEQGMEICGGFKKDKHCRRLPGLDAKDEPFHDVYVYYRSVAEDEV